MYFMRFNVIKYIVYCKIFSTVLIHYYKNCTFVGDFYEKNLIHKIKVFFIIIFYFTLNIQDNTEKTSIRVL
jgi:hypothetical protein